MGKHLAAEYPVPNYQFNVFMEMNQRGRYVIFLDGFDEMKKSMSWDDMRFNFQQLFRLITPKSKVVIFGRPTVFLNEEEYMEIIKGRKRTGKIMTQIPGAPKFEEMFVQSFNKSQVVEFVVGYSGYLSNESSEVVPEQRVNRLLVAIKSGNDAITKNLANRPVHLKMLVELLPYLEYDFKDARISTLYSEFIDYVTNRELKKSVRRRFSTYKRRAFIRGLAWWMWNSGNEDGVALANLDKNLFRQYVADGDDPEDIARDLLTGSILESKNNAIFYFPHRSFLEYLVAEQLSKEIRSNGVIRWV